MDYDKLIESLEMHRVIYKNDYDNFSGGACTSDCMDAALAIETLRADLEQERAHRIHAEQHADAFLKDCEQLNAELERVTAERDMALTDLNTLRLASGWQCYACDNADAPEGNSRCNGCNYSEGNNYKWHGIQT